MHDVVTFCLDGVVPEYLENKLDGVEDLTQKLIKWLIIIVLQTSVLYVMLVNLF